MLFSPVLSIFISYFTNSTFFDCFLLYFAFFLQFVRNSPVLNTFVLFHIYINFITNSHVLHRFCAVLSVSRHFSIWVYLFNFSCFFDVFSQFHHILGTFVQVLTFLQVFSLIRGFLPVFYSFHLFFTNSLNFLLFSPLFYVFLTVLSQIHVIFTIS